MYFCSYVQYVTAHFYVKQLFCLHAETRIEVRKFGGLTGSIIVDFSEEVNDKNVFLTLAYTVAILITLLNYGGSHINTMLWSFEMIKA